MTNYSYKLSISAIDDLSKSYAWYEDKLSGLGERFLISMDNAFDTICINPTAFQVRFNSNVRGYVVNNFPYIILYIVEDATLNIIAVFNTNQDPDSWRAREI
jgi:plasmid stabilization system protein ParE